MKYPQLVSMPSAVQDWLDEQLEARGIDAVVYTRYILSLLQKDALDLTDDILTLSSNKGREVGRRGRKRGRRQEYWNVLDCEQLKRSAAVECLMSASDQKCGIEKLVDELCAKLKEIQSEGETAADSDPPETSVSHQVTQSLQDQVQKYYAAFPPLSSKSNEGNKSLNLVTDLSSVWGTKSISANLLCKNKTVTNSGVVKKGVGFSKSSVENKENQGNIEKFWKEVGRGNMKSRVQLKDKSLGNKKGTCYGFAWSMSGEWGRCSEMSSAEQDESCTSSDWLVSKHNSKNMESTCLTSDESLVMENKDIWNVGVCRRLYQRRTESSDVFNLPQSKEIMGYSDEAIKDSTDDTNLAQLIAKFDHSIEALWNPDDASSTIDNVSQSKLLKDGQNLAPGEKNISSPNEQLFNVEVKNWNNKQNYSYVSCGNNSFIQCGTNITNSIWSDQVTHDNSAEGDELAGEYNLEGSANFVVFSDSESIDRGFEENKDKNIISTEDDDKDQCNVMLVGDGKIVGYRSNSDNKCGSKKICSVENSNINFKSLGSFNKFSNPITEEKSKVVWSKYESFPSFFSSFPLGGINYSLEEFTKNLNNKKWSDVEDSADNYANYDIFATYLKKPSNNMSVLADSIGNCSLNTLNHNREDSSFTEVIPKQPQVNSKSMPQKQKVDSQANLKNDFDKDVDDFENIEKEEEDLLTSTRTHFRPIRQESLDSHNHTGCYADGTTFVIPNSLESITFKRSESGTLYLETEVGLDTPKKYMEYKEKEPYGGRHKFDEKGSNFVNSKLGSEFIPKFRVHQIEKCCQTEETEEMLLSDEEVDPKRSRHDIKADSDFYFPGDELFAEKIINCLEDNDVSHCGTSLGNNNECKNVIKCTTFKTVHMTPRSNSISLEKTIENPETSQQNWCKCSGNNNETPWKFSWPKSSGENTSVCVWNSSDSKPNHLSQSWYDIWSGGPGATTTCQKCCSVMNAGHSLQYRKLREELSQDGEQLLSDLSYLQHLYLGSDCWSDDSAPPPAADWEQMQGGLHTQNLQCLSPTADSCLDVQLYDDSGFMSKSPSQLEQNCGPDLNVPKKPFEESVSTSSPKTFPLKIMLSMELERERDINERPFSAKLVPKDRKRRHSGSQRPGSGQQPDAGCRLPGELSTITCHIWATDPSCLKGTRNRSLRPVTL